MEEGETGGCEKDETTWRRGEEMDKTVEGEGGGEKRGGQWRKERTADIWRLASL